MARNILAEEVTRFTSEGVMEVEGNINKLGQEMAEYRRQLGTMASNTVQAGTKTADVGRATTSFLARAKADAIAFGRDLTRLAGVARLLTAGGGLGLVGIAHGALKGTVEASNFSRALEHLSRVLGDGLAPYVRLATNALRGLADWFRALDPATQAAATKWSVLAVAAGGFLAVLPVLARGVAGVLGIIAAVATPAAALLGLFGAAAVVAASMWGAISHGGAQTAASLKDSNRSWLQDLISWLNAASGLVATFFNKIEQWGFEAAHGLAQGWGRILNVFGVISDKDLKLIDERVARETAKRAARGPLFDLKGINDFFDKLGKGPGLQIKLKVDLESSQGTWDRLLKAMADREADDIPRAQLVELRAMNENAQKGLAALGKVADFVPAVR